ncbi:RAD55 family ATPase [Halorarius halobius]|uniref:RAD55 family ATPase n=1 Tax=Halorarius halobius TaxID=2962671 RepID=UPI0020CEEA0C|nr:transcriptional regulator [Halorarius halobius]
MSDDRRLATGVDALDRKLGGGLPVGTVTALTADPASQSELFLYRLAATRETVYLSTVRPATGVEAAVDGDVEAVRADGDAPLEHAREVVADLPEATNLVVDPMDVLEGCDPARYRAFLSELGRRAAATGSVVLLHCLCDERAPAGRRETLHLADVVFDLATDTEGDSVENRLAVPKFRGGESMTDVVKLDLTGDVAVDVSRNIV